MKNKVDDSTILSKIKEHYQLCKSQYTTVHKRMRLLDAADKGDLWKSLKAKFPPYQILPDTNFISYVKSNLLASIYTVIKSANIQPTSEGDKDIAMLLNIAMERIWDLASIGDAQFQAGERAALLNMGITQVGWDENVVSGAGDNITKGEVKVKNIDPIKFMRDPFAPNLDTAEYCMTYENYHKSVLLNNSNYKEAFKKYLEENKGDNGIDSTMPKLQSSIKDQTPKDYYTLLIYWTKKPDGLYEYHTINGEYILYKKEKIKPAIYPFAILYCNEPAGELVGVSECQKIYANNVAYNMMNSIALTAEYKNQRPPKFISAQSGLNIQEFTKHGDEADKTFIVNTRADQAVHYHQFPPISANMSGIKMGLMADIQTVTGIDGRYTGRDTGSVITTGGVEDMLNRVTLVDTPKITLYEKYTKRLTQLVLLNCLAYSPKRNYFRKNPTKPNSWDSFSVDFPKIDEETLFDYTININSELPKNKQRVAEMANVLMEKQMQYAQEGSNVQLITEEEWLMFQDLPNKEYMLERMGVQRMQDATEEVAQVLFEYADLISKGADPQNAINATAQSLMDKRAGRLPSAEVPAVNQEQAVPEGMMPMDTGAVPMGEELL